MSKDLSPAARWKARQELDRARSQTYRDRSRETGRPLPAAIDRAIAEAVAATWAERIKSIAGDDRDEALRRTAAAEPISPYKIADAAVDILAEKQRRKAGSLVDKVVIGRAVMSRLRPRLPYVRPSCNTLEEDTLT